jgi:hypothetical protein
MAIKIIRASDPITVDRHSLTGCEIAASIACALRWFRNGSSAAKAIEQGQKRARELAWGSVGPAPKGAA